MGQEYRLKQLADHLGAELQGNADCIIRGLNTLQQAGEGELAFLASKAYQQYLATTGASAVILHPAQAADYAGNQLIMTNPYLGYARVSELFNPVAPLPEGIHPTAVIDDSARIDRTAAIGPHVTVGAGAQIGSGTSIGPGCCIGADVLIGENCRLAANVTLYQGVSIGNRVSIHSGAVIGGDGFGFANDRGHWVKIHQLGSVEIGDRVEIGACTTVDRGALGNTIIKSGVIIDNLVQIAHNVEVGENTAIAGCCGIAGSTIIGKNCILAGGVGIVGHIRLCDSVTVTGMSMVTKSITEPGSYSSGTPLSETTEWRRSAVRFGQLDKWAQRLTKIEKNQVR